MVLLLLLTVEDRRLRFQHVVLRHRVARLVRLLQEDGAESAGARTVEAVFGRLRRLLHLQQRGETDPVGGLGGRHPVLRSGSRGRPTKDQAEQEREHRRRGVLGQFLRYADRHVAGYFGGKYRGRCPHLSPEGIESRWCYCYCSQLKIDPHTAIIDECSAAHSLYVPVGYV